MSIIWRSKDRKHIYFVNTGGGLLILVLLGSIAGVVVTQTSKSLARSRRTETRILISDIEKSLEQYKKDCNRYPTSEQGLAVLLNSPQTQPLCPTWGPHPYLKKMPLDAWHNNLSYALAQDGGAFVLTSFGADGKPGGEGFNADIRSDVPFKSFVLKLDK
jgi:general secretion pathway protein G